MSLNKKIAVGAAWALITRLAVKSLGFVSLLIMARLLVPEDFGLIALTMTMVAFFEIFSRFGFDINIIQKQEVDDPTLNSAWTCKVILGAILTLLLLIFSSPIASFFNDDRMVLLIIAASGLPLLKGLENIGFVLFRKELDLKKEFKLEVYAKVASFTVIVGAGVILQSYWALLLGIYANALFRVILSFTMHPFRPKLSLEKASSLLSFSKWLLLNNLLIFFNHKITDLIIGNRSGTDQMGYYSVSYEISNLPTSELVFPLSRAMFPGYAKVQSDTKALKNLFVDFTTVVIFMTAPISFGIYAVAPEAVAVMLGEKWLPAAPVIAYLSLYGLTRSAVQNIGNVFIAKGYPNIPVYISLFRLTIIIPMLLYFVPIEGAKGAAYALFITSLITTPISYTICARFLKMGIKETLGMFVPPLIACAFMVFAIELLQQTIFYQQLNVVLQLICAVTLGISVYAAGAAIYVKTASPNNAVVRATRKLVQKIKKS